MRPSSHKTAVGAREAKVINQKHGEKRKEVEKVFLSFLLYLFAVNLLVEEGAAKW
jgi:hypothetical protein